MFNVKDDSPSVVEKESDVKATFSEDSGVDDCPLKVNIDWAAIASSSDNESDDEALEKEIAKFIRPTGERSNGITPSAEDRTSVEDVDAMVVEDIPRIKEIILNSAITTETEEEHLAKENVAKNDDESSIKVSSFERGKCEKQNKSLKKTKKSKPKIDVANERPLGVCHMLRKPNNWRKAIRFFDFDDKQRREDASIIFSRQIDTYVPCIPPNTSDCLIASLSPSDLEQFSCPGCHDRFLLPASLLHHVYRRSVHIAFECNLCRDTIIFTNQCHLRSHVLNHMQAEGVSSVTAESIYIRPLEYERLNIGLTETLDNVYAEYNNNTSAQCGECRLAIEFPQNGIYMHLDPSSSKQHICKHCGRSLPSACSRSAHERLHFHSHNRQPYVCPECGVVFETLYYLDQHLSTTCSQHQARILAVECRICGHFFKEDDLIKHVISCHVRKVFRCPNCPRAFVNELKFNAHRRQYHYKNFKNEDHSVFLLYQLLFLTRRRINDETSFQLFSSVEDLTETTERITSRWIKIKRNMFKCINECCSQLFADVELFREHIGHAPNHCISNNGVFQHMMKPDLKENVTSIITKEEKKPKESTVLRHRCFSQLRSKIKKNDSKSQSSTLMGLDVHPMKQLMKLNYLRHFTGNVFINGITVRRRLRREKQLKCAVCGFMGDMSDQFNAHIEDHCPQDYLQCNRCGMCFASNSSWMKHLFVAHSIHSKKEPQNIVLVRIPCEIDDEKGNTVVDQKSDEEPRFAIKQSINKSPLPLWEEGDLVIDE